MNNILVQGAIDTSMKHLLLEKKWFDITILSKALDLLGRQSAKLSKDYLALEALHCIEYSEMSAELLQQVLETALAMVYSQPDQQQKRLELAKRAGKG